jgi:hypothetical protein
VVAQQPASRHQRAEGVLGTLEMGQDAGKDGEREPVAARDSPDVACRQLQPAIVTSCPQAIVSLDPRLRALEQGR